MKNSGVVRALPARYGDDASLAEGLRTGSPMAIAAAWDRFFPLVRKLLTRSLGPCHEIEDLVQEVFITLYRRVVDLRDPNALRSFVVGISVRVARSELRRRRVRRWIMLTPTGTVPDLATPESDHTSREAMRSLYAVLDRLDANARLAFVLRHADGLELVEIAAALGCSLATVKRKLAKATERVLYHARKDGALTAFARDLSPAAPPASGRTGDAPNLDAGRRA
jgi:RNA polymerase sigma-70 factor (ECF subfamily)